MEKAAFVREAIWGSIAAPAKLVYRAGQKDAPATAASLAFAPLMLEGTGVDPVQKAMKRGKTKFRAAKLRGAFMKQSFIRQEMEKQAAKLDAKKMFALGAGLAIAQEGANLLRSGISAGVGATGDAFHRAKRTRQWSDVVRADPTLREEPRARTYFDVIHDASPYLAGQPVLAASTVRQLIESGSSTEGGLPVVDVRTIKGILDVEGARQKTRFPNLYGHTSGGDVFKSPAMPLGDGG